ncbi:MAG: argininosuccinate lyase [Rhodothermales bacterium]|jgi:argininosuccinate lyase
MSGPIWKKEGAGAEDWVTRFTVGDDYLWDALLLPFDLTASEAHAWGLLQIGVLDADEFAILGAALEQIRTEHAAGDLVITPEDEDCHTVIERRLIEITGEAGRKIHTGRSRNDQVLAALRLFLRDRLTLVGGKTLRMAELLCDLASRNEGVFLPGYTHMQRAMPSSVSLWALGYAELAADDLELVGQARRRVNASPLGSAAGYGVPHLDLPRQAVADRLGFESVQTHVTAAQLSRGKLESVVVHSLLQVASTVNRLASDLVLYNMSEFGFVKLPVEFSTGSSIMPQKKNPDVLELARGTYHRISAELQLLISLPANLPSGYHRDLQLTKEAVMRAMLKTEDLLTAVNAVLPGLRFDAAAALGADDPALHATAAALKAVKQGTPFRDAYRMVAGDQETWKEAQREARQDGSTYESVGTPGREDPGLVLALLRKRGAWL